MDQSGIDVWFDHEVLRWRTGAAVAWSVLCVPVVALVYSLFSSFQVFHPFDWLYDFFTAPFSLGYMFMMLVAMATQCFFLVYSSRTFTVAPSVCVKRLANLSQLMKSSCLIYTGLCMTCGSVLAWVCTNILGGRYMNLSYKCDEHSEVYCINEHHLFLVLYGGYTGFMYVIYHFVKNNNVLHFPMLQAKLFQVRCRVLKVAWSSLGFVIWQVKFYYVAYYLLGNIPRDWIADTLNLKFGSNYRLDSLYGLLLDVALLWQTVLVGFFLQFMWSFGGLLYNIYSTEHYEFLIWSMFDDYKNKCLVDAMSCINNRLIQALGFHDLNLLANYSYSRRKDLFSLSQPGGHPHNWNKVLAVCLAVINELNDDVKESNWKILAHAPIRHPSTEKSQPQDIYSIASGNTTMNGTKEVSGTSQKSAGVSIKERIMGMIKKRDFLQFFTSEGPETKTRNLFASAFIQIWAVEALSSLVSASFREDSYGVVQMSLKEIIIAILALQENVEKHFKLTGGIGRRVQKDISTNEHPWKYLLHTTLKNSMYKIVNTFGKHLMEIGFPNDVEKKLHHFLEYRE